MADGERLVGRLDLVSRPVSRSLPSQIHLCWGRHRFPHHLAALQHLPIATSLYASMVTQQWWRPSAAARVLLVLLCSGGGRSPRWRPRREGEEGKIWREEVRETGTMSCGSGKGSGDARSPRRGHASLERQGSGTVD